MYKINDLPYTFDSLEPYIDTHTLGLHYNKHTKNYLNKLNQILNSINYDYKYDLNELVLHINEFPEELQYDILFNLGGVLNHETYFESINKKKQVPSSSLLNKINDLFGDYNNFKRLFKESALKLKGSGYTFLVTDRNNNLRIINLSNQDTPYTFQLIPLLGLDMWEHAYYINYENNKDLYIDNFFDIVDFTNANNIYETKIK